MHAYERMNRVYTYMLYPCGPVYITVGDGGKFEKIDINHSDDPGKYPSEGDNKPEYEGCAIWIFLQALQKEEFVETDNRNGVHLEKAVLLMGY